MPQTLEIMQQYSPTAGVPIDLILDAMKKQETGGERDPATAKGKKGEIGLFQIQPGTAKMYNVSPELLTNPVVNRYVAKRYLTDLLSQFKGNLPLALAAYNAGPGRVKGGTIPDSTRSYVRNIMAMSGLDATASRPVAGAKPNIITQTDLTAPAGKPATAGFSLRDLGTGPGTAEAGTVPIPSGASIGSPAKGTVAIPSGASVGAPKAAAKPEPFAVKAAGFLPIAGQFGGEVLGAMGGAAIPGAGETGVPEYLGATTGGGVGAAGGAELENVIRRQYGLPPVSVGEEAAIGTGTSAIGGLLPFVGRFRKAAALAKSTGKSFRAALEEVTQAEAELEGRLGMGARKAQLLKGAPATQAQQGYRAARQVGLDALSDEYQRVLGPDMRKMTPNTVKQVFDAFTGRRLELAGKPLRDAVEREINAEPMTVSRAQQILSEIRRIRRSLNQDTMRAADMALGDLEKALKADIRSVVGKSASDELDNIDYHYARQLRRFPMRQLRAAFTEPEAAELILKHTKGGEGRVLEVIDEMRRTGQLKTLQRATAVRIFQKATVESAMNPATRFSSLVKAVSDIPPDIFDALYGKGAQKEWLDTARVLIKKNRELLAHPDEAAAIAANVRKYLSEPGLLGRMTGFFGHRALWGAMMMSGGYGFGSHELVGAGVGLLGIEGYEMVAHSPVAMRLLAKAALEKTPQLAARSIVAAFDAAMHAGIGSVADDASLPTKGGASATP